MNNKLNNCKECVWSVLVRGLGGGRWFRAWVTLRREVCSMQNRGGKCFNEDVLFLVECMHVILSSILTAIQIVQQNEFTRCMRSTPCSLCVG